MSSASADPMRTWASAVLFAVQCVAVTPTTYDPPGSPIRKPLIALPKWQWSMSPMIALCNRMFDLAVW
jgi:hypothetical protein